MREILFRGKTEKGKWIEGDLYQSRLKSIFMISRYSEHGNRMTEVVNPETVGQYTGLTDKNGTKIFEGDVVCFYGTLYNEMFSIVFADGCFRLGTKNGYSYTLQNLCSALEVIGNIYDNPELLKGERDNDYL